MSKLTKVLKNLHFDGDDVKALDEQLGKFDAYKRAAPSGLPDYSPGFAAYTPILGFAMLKALAEMAKQTRWLIVLGYALGVLAIAQVALIVLQVIN